MNSYKLKQMIKKILFIQHSVEEKNLFIFARNFILKTFTKSTKGEIERRKKLSLFDYQNLSQPLRYYPFFFIQENNFYGNGYVLSKAFNIDAKSRIEHGLYLGDHIPPITHIRQDKIVTFSKYRETVLRNSGVKDILKVGPYINYADHIFNDEEMQTLRQDLGKTLLVFPAHSIDAVTAEYDIKKFIEFIESIKKDYDSVVICMYWKDILLKRYIEYEKLGYRIVTAGHIYDYHFLDRLKTIISLCDMSISNTVGTHVGYCVALERPHYIVDLSVKYSAIDNSREDSQAELNARNDTQKNKLQQQYEILKSAFSTLGFEINESQKQLCEYYWGSTLIGDANE